MVRFHSLELECTFFTFQRPTCAKYETAAASKYANRKAPVGAIPAAARQDMYWTRMAALATVSSSGEAPRKNFASLRSFLVEDTLWLHFEPRVWHDSNGPLNSANAVLLRGVAWLVGRSGRFRFTFACRSWLKSRSYSWINCCPKADNWCMLPYLLHCQRVRYEAQAIFPVFSQHQPVYTRDAWN